MAHAIRDYALIGDGRTAALVARDGSIDWLCVPDLDSPSVFARMIDPDHGGHLALQLAGHRAASRRYVPNTNVLETTLETHDGVLRVTDALTLPGRTLAPGRELARRFECVSGRIDARWTLEPRFDYGRRPPRIRSWSSIAVADAGGDGLAVVVDGGDAIHASAGRLEGRIRLRQGERAMLAVTASHHEPLVLPAPRETEDRLDETISFWTRWAEARTYHGPWPESVMRSALALKLLVYAPSGAVAAAPTTSLPEELGGSRNWDYRFCWVRDSAFTLGALLSIGCGTEARAFFSWVMHASQITRPKLRVLYRLDGRESRREQMLPLAGYMGSTPVRIGNAAADQLQLDIYGGLMQTVWLYVQAGEPLDRDTARRVADIADHVATIWAEPDSGIWEVRSEPRQFTQSKLMCWIALDRALALVARGAIPGKNAAVWRRERDAIGEFVETHCWSAANRSYSRAAGSDELDASVLLGILFAYGGGDEDRLGSTVAAVRRRLASGPYVRRYSGDDGLSGREGAFLTCSFWLVDALARTGRPAEAETLMEELIALANDVGLYSEEIDAADDAFLGNFPQGLTHLALIGAAMSCAAARR
ncbi:MAG TPA: glycoside hydrolase family 15 protein [Gaiellaceae bacterium]|nr:glycoside hydrolase family 15 protein [Gaiellaceae bacterium]